MPLDPARATRLIAGAAVVGLVLRLAFGFGYWVDKPLTHDEREYLALATSIAHGKGFTYERPPDNRDTPRFGRAPLYPVFLAAIGAGAGDVAATPVPVKIAQAIVGAVGVWLIGIIARRAAGPAAGVAAASIAAIYPPLVWICAYVFSESLFSTAALGSVLLLNRSIDRDRDADDGMNRGTVVMAMAAGVVTGLAMLIRPAMTFFVPVAAMWLLAQRRAKLSALLVLGVLLVVTPWTLRNARVYHRFVLIASEGGVTFWTGNHPLATGEGDMAANPEIKVSEIVFRRNHPGLSAEELEPLYYREALTYIGAHPGWWTALLMKKAFYTVVPLGRSYALHSPLYRMSSLVSYLILLPFGLLGARLWWRIAHPPESLFPLAVSAVAVCILFFPQERFRIPVIDPALIVCAAVWYSRRTRETIAS